MSDPIEDYIRANRDQYPREVLTGQMEKAGHDRAAIDAAWGRLTPAPTPPPTWEATAGRIPDQIHGPIVVRTYRGKSQPEAAQLR